MVIRPLSASAAAARRSRGRLDTGDAAGVRFIVCLRFMVILSETATYCLCASVTGAEHGKEDPPQLLRSWEPIRRQFALPIHARHLPRGSSFADGSIIYSAGRR